MADGLSESAAMRLASAMEESARELRANTEAIGELVLRLPGRFEPTDSGADDGDSVALLSEIRDLLVQLNTQPGGA